MSEVTEPSVMPESEMPQENLAPPSTPTSRALLARASGPVDHQSVRRPPLASNEASWSNYPLSRIEEVIDGPWLATISWPAVKKLLVGGRCAVSYFNKGH